MIAIGSNLSGRRRTPLEICRQAACSLDALPGLRLVGLSRWYATSPIPASDQPDYVNGIALLVPRFGGEPAPGALLTLLQAIEAAEGRQRSEPNAARTLDLDIIAMGRDGQAVQDAPDPILPHPRAHQRAFVLTPLLDVAPDWLHPRLRQSARALLAALPSQGVRHL